MHVITYDLSVGGSGKNWRGDASNTRKKKVKVFFSLLSYFHNKNKYDNIIKSMDVYMLIIVCSFNDRLVFRSSSSMVAIRFCSAMYSRMLFLPLLVAQHLHFLVLGKNYIPCCSVIGRCQTSFLPNPSVLSVNLISSIRISHTGVDNILAIGKRRLYICRMR